MSASGSTIPVARGRLPFLGHGMSLLRRPLEFMTSLREYGDVVLIHLGTVPVYVLTKSQVKYDEALASAGYHEVDSTVITDEKDVQELWRHEPGK